MELAGLLGTPGVHCNTCPVAERCPEHKPGHDCAYETQLGGLSAADPGNTQLLLNLFADVQKKRAMRAVFIEQRAAGGDPNPNTTRLIEVAAAAVLRAEAYRTPMQIPMARTTTSAVVQAGQPAQAQGPGLLTRLIAGIAQQGSPSLPAVAIQVTEETPVPAAVPSSDKPRDF